jgi:hypothetical protein
MTPELKKTLTEYFKDEFAGKILAKLKEGHDLSSFNFNPLVSIALSSGVYGNPTPMNMAKALLYPRVFGTSINTTFGDKMQKMCVRYLGAAASGTTGIDIEYEDKLDGQNVVMQLKAGPNTINYDDVEPIVSKMGTAYRTLRQNRADNMPIFAIGITYGVMADISAHYRRIAASSVGGQLNIPIYIGQDFWHRLTGNPTFYSEMISLFVDIFEKEDYSDLLQEDLDRLASEIEAKYFSGGKFDLKKI